MTCPRETATFVAASEHRVALLSGLRESGAADRETCYEWCDASRRTVTRALADFADREWVRESNGRYRLTGLGRAVAAGYERCEERVAAAQRLAPFLSRVPGDDFDLDPWHLRDADLVVGGPGTPTAPVDRALELRSDATRIRDLSPIVARESVAQLAERLESADLDVEAVVSERAVRSALSNPDYESLLAEVRGAEGHSLYVTADPVPFVLGVFDDVVALGATEDGHPHALVVSDAEPVVEWALAFFSAARDDAMPVADWTARVDTDSE
jgi:predicted transcriptional regulator